MLNKELLLKMNQNKEYEKILEIFREDYKSLLLDFFERKNIKPMSNSLIHLIAQLNYLDDGKYRDISDYLTDMFFYDENSLFSSLELAIDMYNTINSILKA